ncbi:hypothetical protein PVAND_010328 [Polypedilum vanderplanki]|uniref:Octanoyl-[acyl-carrier-protein]:protein N-octanoyltransferase LIPT2, mitochondrial n=1 Tax=Polypedilum vanderplanki TaxID=319348 RepID=A0A9J6CG25_POLVA|nr:hypothetical protein PVAND_010328 [Polypedilum vanderplanki]
MNSTKLIHIFNVGKLPYLESLNLQKFISTQIIQNTWNYKNVLILTEHYPVYTIGIRTKNYTIEDENKLRNLGAEFIKTNRGGLITFHGPGQLVAYPIINLKNFKQGVRWYVNSIERTIINLCHKYELNATTTTDTGVWINDRKICAIGIHVSRYVTMHGLALNCNTDLSWFNHIVPCGIEDKEVTSLSKECKRDIQINDVIPELIASFSTIFESKTILVNQEQVDEIKKNSLEK